MKKTPGVAFVINTDLSVFLPACMDKCSAALKITWEVKCSCCWHQTPLSGMKYVSVFQVMVGTKEATHPSCKIWASTTCKVFGVPVLPNMQLKPLWCSSEALTDCYCNVQSLANFIVLCTCIYCCVVQNRICFLMCLPNKEKRKWILWFTLPACNFSLWIFWYPVVYVLVIPEI